ncbi:7tm 7 domain containing protein [Asbolus verrucosus]|uniref:Gustatory receptor n=1 Tax=Asbolus verrucosus TaxID=1661398 RepID=A0A482VEQ1_ASBVE|nr:7tm 7 domain containing protein [Asbolus verrucosus]
MGIPLKKPKERLYNLYVLFVIVFFATLTVTSLLHILKKDYFTSNPMNGILHILVYMVINILDIIAIIQDGYCKGHCVDELLTKINHVRTFLNAKTDRKTEKKLLKLQKFDFILMHVCLIPWFLFMSYWIWFITGGKGYLVYGLIYFNYYLTSMEVMKILKLLQLIKHSICESNKLFFKTLNERNYLTEHELKSFLKNYDDLIDCIQLFNEAFGLQILGTVVVTPFVMVQAIFFNLSRIIFPSLIRTIIVNVATVVKFTHFLILSFMIATPSKRIAKEFQNTCRICNTFRTNSAHNDEVPRVLELLSLQLQNRKKSISAAGFFDADYTIILNIVVSTVSYVIVFLQINAKLPKNT